MAAGTNEELLKKLDETHRAYLQTFKQVHEALYKSAVSPSAPSRRRRRSTMEPETERPFKPSGREPRSFSTGDSDFSDDDDELYVSKTLAPYKYDEQHLRDHLKKHDFNKQGRKILETVIDQNQRLLHPEKLFPHYPSEEKYHNSHYSVFDVGTDGAPVSRRAVVSAGSTIDSAIWQAIKDLNSNSDPAATQKVGRITIIREPAPIILGALHLTMNDHFDMDEIFEHLLSADASTAHIANRAFDPDERRQRSFVFNFDYYTVIGEDCAPMPWQLTDIIPKKTSEHIPISRCSSVVALSLQGDCVKELNNFHRRAKTHRGYIFDPWAPWHVLNIQCYPDHKHSMDSHDSTKHYVNGPEAFLTTLLAEFKDAQKRFEDINNRISKLVTPSAEFMFSRALRDKLLFEDDDFTYSRRYFWAYQTLGTMKNAIKAIIDGYEDTFTEEVWEGKHKSLWPMLEEGSPRNVYWRKRMHGLKKDFEKEIRGLKTLYEENDDLRKEIRTLRDQLFSGTSVLESRKSVELSTVTILQGHNIKLLTLVSIFFLPLTFVTSVFGMTNMPSQGSGFKNFAIVMAVVCVPFFLLIGSLNTTSGLEFWRGKWHMVADRVKVLVVRKRIQRGDDGGDAVNKGPEEHQHRHERTLSTSQAIAIRGNQLRLITPPTSPRPRARNSISRDHIQPHVVEERRISSVFIGDSDDGRAQRANGNGSEAVIGESLKGVGSVERGVVERSDKKVSWWESLLGRKKKGVGDVQTDV